MGSLTELFVSGGRQGVTLWQFILELLADETCHDIVAWTETPLEFKVCRRTRTHTECPVSKERKLSSLTLAIFHCMTIIESFLAD